MRYRRAQDASEHGNKITIFKAALDEVSSKYSCKWRALKCYQSTPRPVWQVSQARGHGAAAWVEWNWQTHRAWGQRTIPFPIYQQGRAPGCVHTRGNAFSKGPMAECGCVTFRPNHVFKTTKLLCLKKKLSKKTKVGECGNPHAFSRSLGQMLTHVQDVEIGNGGHLEKI